MSDTPRTKDAFDALARRACGTEYVKAKMEELERELAAVTAERDSLAHYAGCQPAHSDYQTADQMRADLDSAVAELSAMTAERDAARSYLAKVTAERDAAIRELGDTAQKMGRMEVGMTATEQHMSLARVEAGCPDDETLVIHCRELRADLDAERAARKAGQRVLEKVQSWMLEPDRSKAQSFTSVEVGAALALAAKLP